MGDRGHSATTLRGVSETLLIPLTARVLDSRDPKTSFRDPYAEALAEKLDVDVGKYAKEWPQLEAVVGRTAIFDAITVGFMQRHEDAQVVGLGAGLCTRLDRLDDGRVRWVDVDLPAATELARELRPVHPRRCHVAASVLQDEWHRALESGRPTLFIAEGLLMYLNEDDVRSLLCELARRYPGAEIALEGVSPFLLRSHLGQGASTIRRSGAQFRWGLGRPSDLRDMVPGLSIIDVKYPAEVFPHRWRWMRVLRPLKFVTRAMKVVHARFAEIS